MTPAEQLIQTCQQQGIKLYQNGDKLTVTPTSKLTPELRASLIQHKPEILRLVPPRNVRPVFSYILADNAMQPFIMLGLIGMTTAEARASLYDRYGKRLRSVADYVYPPPERVQ